MSYYPGQQRDPNLQFQAGLSSAYGGGRNMVDAPPNLWNQTQDWKTQALAGLQGSRPIIGQNDYAGNAQQYGQLGLAGQQSALGLFAAQANGTGGPSLAQLQMQQGLGQQQRAAMSMAGSARGGNLAGQYQSALSAQGGAMANYNQQAGILQAQEQMANRQAYAGLASQMAQQGLQYDQLGLQNALGQDQNALGWYSAKRGLDQQQSQNRWGRTKDVIQLSAGGASGAAQMLGMSDVRAKEDLQPVSAADAAAQVEPLAYRYKDGMGLPGGQQIGVSAQQLQGTPLGSTLVQQGPDGMLRVDGGRAGIAGLAASGENARRIRMLEQQLAQQTGQGTDAQRYGTREEGQRNEERARMLSNDIASQRGLASMRRDQPQAYDFSGSPQMRRGAPQTIDPFTPSTVGPNTTDGLAGLRARYFPELVASDERMKRNMRGGY